MSVDYWQKFLQSGSVEDYLKYRASMVKTDGTREEYGLSDAKNYRDSPERGKNQGER